MINTPHISVIINNDKLHVNYLSHGQYTLSDVQKMTNEINKRLLGHSQYDIPMIITSNRNVSFTSDARNYLASEMVNMRISSIAIIAKNNFQALVANLFISLTTSMMPSKLFFNFDSAVNWSDDISELKSFPVSL